MTDLPPMMNAAFLEEIRDCPELTAGETVNGWRVIELIGGGGFGKVFKAKKDGLVGALKIYSVAEENASRDEKWRFLQEIQILKAARGVYAPKLYDSGEHNGVPYFVMEYLVPVKPSKMPQTDGDIAKLMLDLTDALGRLHELKFRGAGVRGWVHCDIKPDNIARRANGQYVLIDFGSAHEMDPEGAERHCVGEDSMNYRSGRYWTAGTKYYEPPELCFRPCRDVYALGHLLRDCFGETVPFEWGLIVNKCISWQPNYRYKDVEGLRHDIFDLEKNKQQVYWQLRTAKIKEQRSIERSLAKAEPRPIRRDAIMTLERTLSSAEMTVFSIQLKGPVTRYIVREPIRLPENAVLIIGGRGVLEADISGPSSSIVVLKTYAVLNNVNPKLPPENDVLYAIVGPGGYLNLPNIKERDRAKFFPAKGRRIFRDIDAATAFRFGGPGTFSGVERQSIEGLKRTRLPKRYRDQLVAFFKGEVFSVMPKPGG